jgi:hypothetical protein
MMGRRQRLIDGWEWDWVSIGWRRVMNWKPGEGKRIKRKMNKRARRKAKMELSRLEV